MEASAEMAIGGLGAGKENLKSQLRSCRPGKRVIGGERAPELAKKARVGQVRQPVSRSWSECNLGPGQMFGGLGSEGVVRGREAEGGALRDLVAEAVNAQPKRFGTGGGKVPELVSPMGGPLGFTIKVQRHGRASEVLVALESSAASAGSFASAGRFSLLGRSHRDDSSGADGLSVSKEPSQPLVESRVRSFSQFKTISSDEISFTVPQED